MRGRVTIGVAGALLAMGSSPALAAPGDLDPSFGEFGIAPRESAGITVVEAPDGRILTVGTFRFAWGVRRFSVEGNRDASFGVDGDAALDPETSPQDMGVDANGRIVVVGQRFGTGSAGFLNRIRVYRFTPSGAPDPSFGGDGQVTLDLGTGNEVPGALTFGADGRILVGGSVDGAQAVVALAEDGTLDSAFATGGLLTLPEGGVVDLEPFPGGGHLVAGVQRQSPTVMLTRIDADGAPVPSYGEDGTRALAAAPAFSGHHGGYLSVDPSGRAAFADLSVNLYGTRGVTLTNNLYVLDPQGDVDGSFDLTPALGIADDGALRIDGLTWDGTGRLIVTGAELARSHTAFIARTLPDGALDPGFGRSGVGWFPSDFSAFRGTKIESPVISSGGGILAQADGIVRFLDVDGTRNADADALPDDGDACPLRSSSRRNGCARERVRFRQVDSYAGEAFGRVVAPRICLRASPPGGEFRGIRVRLYADRDGVDRQVARKRVAKSGKWQFDDLSVGGPLYAKVAPRHHPGFVDCSGARSKGVFPGR